MEKFIKWAILKRKSTKEQNIREKKDSTLLAIVEIESEVAFTFKGLSFINMSIISKANDTKFWQECERKTLLCRAGRTVTSSPWRNMEIPHKGFKNRKSDCMIHIFHGSTPQGLRQQTIRDVHIHAYCSTVLRSQNPVPTSMPINCWMEREHVVYEWITKCVIFQENGWT